MKILSLLLITFLNAAPAKSAKTKDIPDSNVKVEQKAKKDGQKSTRVVREFNDDNVVQTMEILGTDIVCKQVFKRV